MDMKGYDKHLNERLQWLQFSMLAEFRDFSHGVLHDQ